MNTSSTQTNEKNIWKIRCGAHFFWTPAIQRLWKALERELNPEFFELLDYKTLSYTLASWNTHSSSVLERFFKLLRDDGYSYTLRLRGVRVSATAIHLHGYFELNTEHVRFQQLRAKIERAFREYDVPVFSLGQVSIPIVRFKNTYSHQHLPNLDRWEECEFGELRMAHWRLQQNGRGYGVVPLQKFIAHRGNIKRRFAPDENKPALIDELNSKGIGCEIDVWFDGEKYWLGHDAPEHEVSFEWLMQSLPLRLYHCKNRQALDRLHRECGRLGYEVNLFYHTKEDYALTSRGHIIVHPDQFCLPDSIEMMPEMSTERKNWHYTNAVCSDSDSFLLSALDSCADDLDSE